MQKEQTPKTAKFEVLIELIKAKNALNEALNCLEVIHNIQGDNEGIELSEALIYSITKDRNHLIKNINQILENW
jgi:hypothetical protein